MPVIDVEFKNDIALVRLKNGVTNAISLELISELSLILGKMEKDAAAMILTGNDRFFSMGFDLPRVMGFDRARLETYLTDFQSMLFQMAFLPLPVIVALTGHAVAGGAILAVACDYRIAKSDKLRIGFNESLLGLSLPYLAELMLDHFVGSRICGRLVAEGSLIKSENAAALGLVDEACPLGTVMERSIQKARQLLEIPAKTFAAMKENHLETIREKYLARVKSRTEQFMDLWFAKETQKRLASAMEKF